MTWQCLVPGYLPLQYLHYLIVITSKHISIKYPRNIKKDFSIWAASHVILVNGLTRVYNQLRF